MKQNIYDNPIFFAGYSTLRKTQSGLNEVLEQPAIASLLPETIQGNILDLGCGDGSQCLKLLAAGADAVMGVDISSNMIAAAHERTAGSKNLTFHCMPIEDFQANPNSFDLVISSLAFHYIADIGTLFENIHTWLKDEGLLIFSIEHPIATCAQGIHPGWQKDEHGHKIAWQADCYANEGERRSHWYIDDVLKYHRTTSTIVNTLIDCKFQLIKMLEPHALESAEAERPSLLEERRRPPFLMIKMQKI